MKDKQLSQHIFNLSPKENGGEGLTLSTVFYHNGDPDGIYVNQELTLQSYGNSATFNLCGSPLLPDMLRKLANQLDDEMMLAKRATRV